MRRGCLKKPLIGGSFCPPRLSKRPNEDAGAADVARVQSAWRADQFLMGGSLECDAADTSSMRVKSLRIAEVDSSQPSFTMKGVWGRGQTSGVRFMFKRDPAAPHRVLKVFLSRTAQRIPYMTSWRVLRLLGVILLIVCWFLVAWTSAVCEHPDRKSALIDAGYTPDGLQFSMCLLDRWDYMMAVGKNRLCGVRASLGGRLCEVIVAGNQEVICRARWSSEGVRKVKDGGGSLPPSAFGNPPERRR